MNLLLATRQLPRLRIEHECRQNASSPGRLQDLEDPSRFLRTCHRGAVQSWCDSTVGDTPRRLARDLIVAVLENMRRYQEPLMYSMIAPSRYLVYLHPAEYRAPRRHPPVAAGADDPRARRRSRKAEPAVECCSGTPDGCFGNRRSQSRARRATGTSSSSQTRMARSPKAHSSIDSELRVAAEPELGAGDRTRRITTVHLGQRVTHHGNTTVTRPARPDARVLARLTHDDDAGPSRVRRREGFGHDRPRRHRLSGRHHDRVVCRRLARARADSPRSADRRDSFSSISARSAPR